MRFAVTVVAVATVTMVATAPAGAAQETPREVAEAFFKAVAEGRWRDAARAMDLLAFDRYRRERIAAARLPRPPIPPMTVDEYLQHEADMPRVVAEYHVRKINERRSDPTEPTDWLLHEFAEVPSVDSLAKLFVEEAAARWLRAQDLRWTLRQARERERARGCPLPGDGADVIPAPAYHVVGEAIVDSTTAYVLHEDRQFRRAEPDVDAAMHATAPAILTFRRRGDRWRILPRETMLRGGAGVGFVSVRCLPAGRSRPPR